MIGTAAFSPALDGPGTRSEFGALPPKWATWLPMRAATPAPPPEFSTPASCCGNLFLREFRSGLCPACTRQGFCFWQARIKPQRLHHEPFFFYREELFFFFFNLSCP